jgi:outer membrane protein
MVDCFSVRQTNVCLPVAVLASVCAAMLARADAPPTAFDNPTDPAGRNCMLSFGGLTFAAAVDYALCTNPQTRGAWAAARAQAAAVGAAKSAWYPELSATGGGKRTSGDYVDATGNNITETQNTGDATISLSWVLYDFGGRSGRIDSAKRLYEAAGATAVSVVQQVIRSVVQGYYGVVAADANLEAARLNEQATAKSLEIARTLQQGGVGTQADVLQAQTAHEQAVLAQVQALANTKSSRGSLAVALGLTADVALVLAPDPVPAQVPALSARMADLMAEAERQRPDLAAARARADSAAADVRVARATGLPQISLGAQHTYISTTSLPNQNFSQFGVTVTVPIFTGFNTVYSVREARETLAEREASVEQTRLAVSLDVWNAYYGLDSANQQLGAAAALLKTADDNEQVALGRYQSGVGTILDVVTAQSAAAAAREQRINAELGWKVARAQMAFALGRLSSAAPLAGSAALP